MTHLAVALFCLALLVAPLGAEAQPAGKVHRIGVITPGAPPASGPPGPATREMLEQLRKRGWVEGQNIALEYRFDEGKRERMPTLAAELVALKVSVIVVVGTTAALAAKRATATIPIVMVNVGDPVRSGLVASLSHPGGNVTGMSLMGAEVISKQVEFVKAVLALSAGALGVLFDPVVDRRAFIAGTLSLLATPLAAEAQPSPVPRIGVLRPGLPFDPYIETFRQALRDLGYEVIQ